MPMISGTKKGDAVLTVVLYKAILGVGVPLHKPYPYSLYSELTRSHDESPTQITQLRAMGNPSNSPYILAWTLIPRKKMVPISWPSYEMEGYVNSHCFFSEKMQAPKSFLTSIFGLRTTWKPIRYCRLCFRMPCAQVALKQSENDASVACFHKLVKLDHQPFSVRP